MGILTSGWGGIAVLVLGIIAYLARIVISDEPSGEDVRAQRVDQTGDRGREPKFSRPDSEIPWLA